MYDPADATASQNPIISCLIQIQTGKMFLNMFHHPFSEKTMDNMDIPVSLTRSVHPVSFDPASSCVPGYRDVYTHTYTRTSIICTAVRCNGLNPRRGLSFYWHGFNAIYHIILYTISAFQLKKNFQLNPTHHLSNKLYSYLFKQHHTSCGCSYFTS